VRRVVIVGSGGAGKSTLALRLGAATGLPVVHLDREFWRPGWVRTPREEWFVRVEELLAAEAWIMDGNFDNTMELRFAAADTIVVLDLPTRVCMLRALRRSLLGRWGRRPDLAEGCDERIDREFLRWVWRFRRDQLPKIMRRVEAVRATKRVVLLRSNADVEAFVESAAQRT
jgi:adenylate kinase family enzyme